MENNGEIKDKGIIVLHEQIVILDNTVSNPANTDPEKHTKTLSVGAYDNITIDPIKSSSILIGPKTRVILFEEKNFGGRSYVIDNNTEQYELCHIKKLLDKCDFDKIESLIIPETYDYYYVTPLYGYEGFGNRPPYYDDNLLNIIFLVIMLLIVYYIYLHRV